MTHPQKLSLIEWTFQSKCIGRQMTTTILLPYGPTYKPKGKTCKVLWLLHGKNDYNFSWLRSSVIENLARDEQIAVIMPDAENSFYCDMIHGPKFFSYITEELPDILYTLLPLSRKQEDNFIAGYSMGGYGALKIALTFPDRFCAVGAFSSVTNLQKWIQRASASADPSSNIIDDYTIINCAFGSGHIEQCNDLYSLLTNNCSNHQTHYFIGCGKQDSLYNDSIHIYQELLANNYTVHLYTLNGEHTWYVWNECITQFFEMLRNERILPHP